MKLPPSSNFRPLLGKVSSKKYPDDIEGHWSLLKSTILATSKPILGYKSRKPDYRGISRLSTTGKVLARVLANRLLPLSEEVLPESKCGFRPSRGTSRHDIHCTATPRKMLWTKAAFIYGFYLTKAFDMVDRQALWSILSRYGCHDKYIRILRLLHDGMEVTVLSNGGTKSEPFTVETGVKQGCVIAPTLFVIFIAAILHLIGEELPQEIPIMYRTNGRLFNLNRFKAKRKVNCTKITELKYADDNVIAAHSAKDLQGILNAFAKANRALGLKLNIKKTQFLHQSPPYELAIQPSIKVDNTTLEYVDHLPYLDSILSSKADKRLTIAWFVPVEPTPGSGEKSLKLKTYQPKQNFWSTEPSSSPPCCVELSHGPPTAGIWEPWNNTIKKYHFSTHVAGTEDHLFLWK